MIPWQAVVVAAVLLALAYGVGVGLLVRADTRWRELDGPRPWDDDAD